MKKSELALAKVATNPELERLISKKDAELKNLARKNGKHFASKNLPAATGDSLETYVGEFKTGYEQTGSDAHHFLQPGTHLPEGQVEADHAKAKIRQLEDQIFHLEEQNKHDEYELHSIDGKSVWNRLFVAVLFTGIILLGEIVFNAKAFEFSGDNMLFALISSISVSFSVYAFSHVVPIKYRKIETPEKKRIYIFIILAIMTGFFSALAVLRSLLLAQENVSINPVYFVIINLFLFTVSVFLSYYLMPSWEEIKGTFHNIKLHRAKNKRKKEIAALQAQIEEIKKYLKELAQQIIRINYYTEYTDKRIEKMYHESVAIFKNENLRCRTDRKVPDCFNHVTPPANIHNQFNATNYLNNKQQ